MSRFKKHTIIGFAIGILLAAGLATPVNAQDGSNISTQDLISLVNGIRTGNGLPALEVNSILMGTAQSTAEIMAANRMGSHIGNVRGRVMAAGYGGGATAWATENFAVGPFSLEDLAWIWSDAAHMIPMVNPAYQHIGAGVATASDGSIYYIVHAAYTSGSPAARTQIPGTPNAADPTEVAPQWVIPVVTATPAADGSLVHEVKMGQSLWSIAIAYNTHIVDILRLNNLSPEQQVVWIGQKLNIPATSQPVAPAVSPEPAATIATPRLAAANLKPAAQPTSAPSRTAEISPTATAVSPLTAETPSTDDTNDLTILFVLAGVFAAGVILIIVGLFAKRARS
ncbi:MAG: LysM peptidoglycan-binding domain-containing protein [Bellilinea sp.]